MFQRSGPVIRVAPRHQPVFRELGIDAEGVFTHPLIQPWRTLDDRQNCVLDTILRDGRHVRWHVKRYAPALGWTTPADDEAQGQGALVIEQIPTVELIAWGKLPDRRSFVILEDLAGYQPVDKLLESGQASFSQLLQPTANLAARLHLAGLHHRDLYLCHFFAKIDASGIDLRLIDTARVRRLPGLFTRARWIVKDLAQFWYSTTRLGITDLQRTQWLEYYAQQRGLASVAPLGRKIERKSASIARHDRELRRRQPGRNISIPQTHTG